MVVVPVWGQWPLVPGLLAALAAQTLPADRFEASSSTTTPAGSGPPLACPGDARILPCPRPAPTPRATPAPPRRGARCSPSPTPTAAPTRAGSRRSAAAAADAPDALLAGPVRMTAPAAAEPLRRLRAACAASPRRATSRRGYAATANLAVPAAVFAALGGFDARRRSGGDAEFCRRAGRAGHPLRLVPGAAVAHPCPRRLGRSSRVKARRVKGGQVAAGPPAAPHRLAPAHPDPAAARTRALPRARRTPWPPAARRSPCRFRLWGVELAETARLLAGGAPERRRGGRPVRGDEIPGDKVTPPTSVAQTAALRAACVAGTRIEKANARGHSPDPIGWSASEGRRAGA